MKLTRPTHDHLEFVTWVEYEDFIKHYRPKIKKRGHVGRDIWVDSIAMARAVCTYWDWGNQYEICRKWRRELKQIREEETKESQLRQKDEELVQRWKEAMIRKLNEPGED